MKLPERDAMPVHGQLCTKYSGTAFHLEAGGNRYLGDINEQDTEVQAVAECQHIEGSTDWIVLRNNYRFNATTGRWDFLDCAPVSTSLPQRN